MSFYEENRHGSAKFADDDMIFDAGITRGKGFYLGETEYGDHCHASGPSAVLCCAGARGGKGSNIIPSLITGFPDSHVISMDSKRDNGSVTGLQPHKKIINWAPRANGMSMNPVSYLLNNSATLAPDAKFLMKNWIVSDGGKDGDFFAKLGRRYAEAGTISYAEQYGAVDLPGLADALSLIGTNTDTWVEFEAFMHNSRFGSVRAVAEEVREIRQSDNPNAGGFGGAKSEILNSFECLSDDELRASVSAPFDFDISELNQEDAPPYQINIQESMEFIESSAPVVRAIYSSILLQKRRSIGTGKRVRDQVWLLDEIGNMGAWPLAVSLAAYGAGYGVRPIYVVQSLAQLDNLAPRASAIINNSCGTRIFRAVGDGEEAIALSKQLGDQTLAVEDFALNERARIAQYEALDAMLFDGDDPFTIGNALAYQDNLTAHPKLMARPLMTPDEILNMHPEMALVLMRGQVGAPLRLRVRNYWERPDLRGKYLGDPFHNKLGTVSIAGRFRKSRKAKVITEPIPKSLEHLPQYRETGTWSYVKGFRPKIK